MGSLASIRHFCEVYKSKYNQLDVLIHNAGCFNHGVKAYQLSPEGIELTFATNVFGPFLMSMLLKDVLAQCQNLYSVSPEKMANNYYIICEDKRLREMTGIILSGKGELIEKQPEKMNNWKMLKDGLLTSRYYPAYTVDKSEVNKLWELCERITQSS